MAHGLAHAPHLALAALVDGDAQAPVPHPPDPCRRRAPVLQVDPLAQAAQGLGRGDVRHLGQVLLLHPVGGMGEAVGQLAVVGQQQETLGVGVQASHGEHPGLPGHQAHRCGPALGIGRGRDRAPRLVEQVVDEAGGGSDHAAVHFHAVALGVDPLADARGHTVDPHPAGVDELLARPPAGHPGAGQHLLQTLSLCPTAGSRLRSGPAPGPRRHPSDGRSPCSSASTVSGAGTKSPSGGSWSTWSRPSFSRNSGVVPNRTANPGPGSRATSSM